MASSYFTSPLWMVWSITFSQNFALSICFWTHSLHAFPERFHNLEESVNNLLLDPDSIGSLGDDVHETMPKRISLSDLINNNINLPKRLTQQQLKADVDYTS